MLSPSISRWFAVATCMSLAAGQTSKSAEFFETDLNPRKPSLPSAKIDVLRHGPYAVGAKAMKQGKDVDIKMPCSNCYITAIQADLQWKNGTSAHIAPSGAWMHHMVLANRGSAQKPKKDPICPKDALRWFASGNERTPVRFNGKGKYGLRLDTSDRMVLVYELVNLSGKADEYYVAMTYEWIPIPNSGYKDATLLWLDITGCGNSDYPPQEGVYEIKSPAWNSTISGNLITAFGHVHDGGAAIVNYVNGKPVCTSTQYYATKPGYQEAIDSTASSTKITKSAYKHVSEASSCVDFGRVNKGDSLVIGAQYNTPVHGLNSMSVHGHAHEAAPHGKGHESMAPKSPWAPIMGISLLYIG